MNWELANRWARAAPNEDDLKHHRDEMRKLAANHQNLADQYELLALTFDMAILLRREGRR